MEILEIKNLNVLYNGHTALKDINLKVCESEYVCLVGKNGSGKSTLLKSIIGLLKKDSGTINLKIEKSEISYLSQNSLTDINFPATAKEIIMTGLQKHNIRPFYSKNDYKKLDNMCELLNIKDIMNKKIGDLSGGQRQKVIIARTLIGNPKLLLLDEPCSGLDTKSIKNFYDILDSLNNNENTTILMATHDIDEINNKSARVICLDQSVKFDGNILEYNETL